MKIIVLSSLAYSLVNFRGDLLKAMIDNGHTVIACAPDRDLVTQNKLTDMGVEFDVSRERVRQLEARALKKLRETQPAQRLHPILEP